MATTAEYRNEALLHERERGWLDAAASWDRAIAAYPRSGPLADLDKAKMQKRADACLATYREQQEDAARALNKLAQ